MLTWLVSLTASSLTFALADVLCDIVINETGDGGTPKVTSAVEEEEDEDGVELTPLKDGRGTDASDASDDDVTDLTRGEYARLHAETPAPKRAERGLWDNGPGLTGEQDAAIAGAPASPARLGCVLGREGGKRAVAGDGGRLGEPERTRGARHAGMVTIIGLFFTVLYWIATGPPGGWTAESKLKWSPVTHIQFWCATASAARGRCHGPQAHCAADHAIV